MSTRLVPKQIVNKGGVGEPFGGPAAAQEPPREELCGKGLFDIDFFVDLGSLLGETLDLLETILTTLDEKMGVGLGSSF